MLRLQCCVPRAPYAASLKKVPGGPGGTCTVRLTSTAGCSTGSIVSGSNHPHGPSAAAACGAVAGATSTRAGRRADGKGSTPPSTRSV